MPERIVLIVNPRSTRVGGDLVTRTATALGALGSVRVAFTGFAGHATALARGAVAAGETLVATLGGDGTVNEVATELAGTQTPLLPVPGGSTNVFARAIGWEHPAARMLIQLGAESGTPNVREVHLGRVQTADATRVFCVNAGAGLDAEAVRMVEAHPWIKTRLRHTGFAVVTAATAVREAARRPQLRVSCDGRTETLAAVVVATGAPFAFLGSRRLELVPGADFGERLRWIGLRSVAVADTARAVAGALHGGRHVGSHNIVDGWASGELVVESDRPVAVQADGEALGRHELIRFGPGPVLRVLVPGAGR